MGASSSTTNATVSLAKHAIAEKKSLIKTNRQRKNKMHSEDALSTTSNGRLEVVSEDTVKLILEGDVHTGKTSGSSDQSQETFDVHRCFFMNPVDNTHLVVQMGPYGHCDGCLVKRNAYPAIIYRIPSELVIQNTNNNNMSECEILPPISNSVRIESEVDSNGAPTGKLRWKGEAFIPTGYFPFNARQYCIDTIRNTHINSVGIPDDTEFNDISEIANDECLELFSLNDSNGYSQVWVNHVPNSTKVYSPVNSKDSCPV